MPEVPDVLKPLAQKLYDPEPRVLLLVGTGVSAGATDYDPRATWRGLLLDALERIRRLKLAPPHQVEAQGTLIEGAFAGAFDLDEILQRAEAITKVLGGATGSQFANWLNDSVGALSVRSRSDCSTIEGIVELARAGALVMTTNYDSLLSEATGFRPVTWEDPSRVLEVVHGDRKAIIHIHGHWETPSSIILDRSSYDRISSNELVQTVFRSLFFHWHWLYIGCGSGGIKDPNLGALLQWMQKANIGGGALTHYFLGTQQTINALPQHVRTAQFTAYPYGSHNDLSPLLRQLAPSGRPYPFQRVGSAGPRVRKVDESPRSTPLPSWQEYLDRVVPKLDADLEVAARLCQHGWAIVQDVVSTGKTTLAFRIAATPEFRDAPCYYLSLSQTIDNTESKYGALGSLMRLARPGVLFIIDDIHQKPTLAEALWRIWRERPMESRLLLLRTTTQRKIDLTGESAWPRDQENPALEMGLTSNDLGAIANCVLTRLRFSNTKEGSFPPDTLDKWHDAYGQSIGAFVVAITQKARQVAAGNTELPPSLAAAWMRERHLKRFRDTDIANATCLAVFSHQDLELQVPEVSLPHPCRIGKLMTLGLAEEHLSDGGRYPRYGLRATQWGEMILSAVSPRPERLSVLSEAAGKDIALACAVSLRLHRAGKEDDLATVWRHLGECPERLMRSATYGLNFLPMFFNLASQHGGMQLRSDLWQALAAQPERLADRALAERLGHLSNFLTTAREQGQKQLLAGLWQALAAEPERLADRALAERLGHLSGFLTTAREQGQKQLLAGLWQALAAQPERLADRAFDGPLDHLSGFLTTARHHGQKQLLAGLWQALAAQPERLADRALAERLDHLSGFLTTAREQGQKQLLAGLWQALAAQPERLADRALAERLGHLSNFLTTAREQGQKQLLAGLWQALAAQPERLADRAFDGPLDHLSSFLFTASQQDQSQLVKAVIQLLDVKNFVYDPELEYGPPARTGAGLASLFGTYEREDLKAALLNNLLCRRNPGDFGDHRYGVIEMSRLLSNVTAGQRQAAVNLIDAVCTKPWLSGCYARGTMGSLAGGLHEIVLHQPPSIVRRFRHYALVRRLEKEFSRPGPEVENTLNEAVQLLGVASLLDLRPAGEIFASVPLEWICRLPDTMGHRPGTLIVEKYQRQLWFGLRIIAATRREPLCVRPQMIEETLNLWRNNIGGAGNCPGTKQKPDTTAHWLNLCMVEWLEKCKASHTGCLLPSKEPVLNFK